MKFAEISDIAPEIFDVYSPVRFKVFQYIWVIYFLGANKTEQLRECAGRSVLLLFAYGIYRFAHDVAQL